MKNVMVPKELLLHLIEYWNGNRNETAMFDALVHITDELDKLLAAAPAVEQEPVSETYYLQDSRSMGYNARPSVDFQSINLAEAEHPSPPADKQAAQEGASDPQIETSYTGQIAMTDLVKLNELDKAEWLDVCKKLKPGLTEADYEKLWCQFQTDKWEYQRSRNLS